ncbi:MAG: hypothetical protein NTX70_09800, partial [Verrucomicrobia bacterium]|nr:hypothetical protein [Verrucomicrobiota bacterium]
LSIRLSPCRSHQSRRKRETHRLESRMREIRPSGSEGGVADNGHPYPYTEGYEPLSPITSNFGPLARLGP